MGTYPITVSGAVDANYAITFVNGTLSVGQAVLTITADNKTKVYGAANPAPTLSYSGFVNGDTAAVLDTAATVGTTATPASPVGTYPITVSGAVDANYAIAFVNGLLSVGRAPLTITADNKTRPVGAANPTFTASYAGFVNGDTPASLDTPVSFSTTAATGSPAGTYPITPLGAVDVNYTIAFVAGTLTVTPVAATTPVLTWADPAPIVYGTALSGVQLNATASAAGVAVVPGTFAYTPGAGAVLNAGVGQTLSVTFTPTDLATYLPATKTVRVTVTPAPLIITADNKTRQQNTANPTLTASYAGFVNNDTAASLDTPVTLTTTAVPSSPTGQYPIVASGAADVNYSITLRNGVLTVTPVTISQLPPPWQNQDVGAVGVAGSASFVDGNEVDMDDDPNLRFRDGIFTINGSGADIGGQADAFQFAYQPWTGDGEVIALVSGIGSADPVAKVGVMFRESLAPDSRHVSMFLHPGGGVFFQRRTAAGAASLSTSIPGLAVPYWVRVTRIGDSFLGYVSEDGWSWFLVGAETLHLPATIQVGLAVTAHNSAALNTATITGVETRLPEVALPEPWLHQDVGAVGSAGSAIFNECTYLVTGSGADIGGQADAFQFVYQPWTGDGDIITRLASVDPTDPGAKAGVMFRASLALDSANALMAVTPGAGGAVFQQRKTTGGATVATADPTHTVPTWLRLTRIGNLFLGYVSADAEIWSFVGAETIVMPPTIQVGLAVTAHNNAARNTSAFTQVDIAPPDLPTIAISSPRANRTFVAPCTVTLGVDVSHNCSVYKKTEFYANGVLLGEDNVDYSFIWNPTVVGTYVLTARAVFYGDLTVTSLPVTITVAARPSTPVGLTATASAPDRITLAWSAGSGGSAAAGYVVERAAPGGSYVQVGTTGPATFTFSEGGLTQGKTYYYRVRGTNALGSSAPSVMAVGRTFLPRIQVNFQPAAAPVPAGYLVDSGLPFRSRGNGYSYGWNINNSAFAVDRDSPNSANQAYDTFQYMQLCATVWEIAVPNGWYTVSIVAGDATLIDSTYRISVEGTPTVTGTPTTAARWVSGTATVNVADGRLTVVNGAGAVNNKICFISIDQVSGPGTPNNNITPNLNLFAAASVSEGSTPALPKVAWLGRDPGNQFTLQVLGVPEGGYEIEASEDLLHWVTQPVVPNLDGTVSFEDPLADARSRRFFRARILQP